MRILALGDSYTDGTSVDPADRWVDRLVERLRASGIPAAATVVAEDGWATDELAAGVDRRSPADDYDLVTLVVGANDSFRGRPVEAFRSSFDGLLERAVGFAGGDAGSVVVGTVPDYSRTPFGRAHSPDEHTRRLAAYNRVIRAAADDVGARVVDLAGPSREAASDPTMLADDGLHPSAAQHELWLEHLYPVAVAALGGVE